MSFNSMLSTSTQKKHSKQFMAELLIVFVIILCHLFIGIDMITRSEFNGELEGMPLTIDLGYVIAILFLVVLGYFFLLTFYRLTKDKKLRLFGRYKLVVNKKRFSLLFMLFTSAHLLFFILTGVGKVGGDATSPISFVFAMFNVNCLFGLYYFLCRDSKYKIIYIVNILLFCTLQIVKGWSSILLTVFMYEVYFYFKRNPHQSFKNYLKALFFPIISLLIGGKIYQYVHAYKNLIRYDAIIENSYYDGLTLLLSRMSYFPISIGAFQNVGAIKELYYRNFVFLREAKALFRPLTPGFIMPDKDFRIIGNLVMQSYYPDITESTSSNFGLMNYLYILFNVSYTEFIIFIILSLLLVILTKTFFDTIEQTKGELNFLYFVLLLNLYEVSTLEMVFGYGLLPIIFFMPFLFGFNIIKVRKLI